MPFTTTVITGATSGIGKETALALAKKDHAIYMLVRDTAKGEKVKDELIELSKNKNIHVIECDLADLQSVHDATRLLKAGLMSVNILINNAGGIFRDYEKSPQGYEKTFAVNHLGHFLLVQLLLPLLEKGQARIINVSSDAHRLGKLRFNDLQWKNTPYSAYSAYATAKLFNIYFTRSLAVKYGPKGISAFALHPGLVSTNFGEKLTGIGKAIMWFMRPFMITPEEGAQTTIYLVAAQRIDAKSGKYFKNKKVSNPSATATNEDARNRLWDISIGMARQYFSEQQISINNYIL
jgi:NAD(P)-dependent dehydrogenase (short-subunit alcohol dehydrogenase family)